MMLGILVTLRVPPGKPDLVALHRSQTQPTQPGYSPPGTT